MGNIVCRKLNAILLPLQVFFNFLIFAASEVDVMCQANHEMSLFGALRKLFTSSNTADAENELIGGFVL
jgi:hypothetical protein